MGGRMIPYDDYDLYEYDDGYPLDPWEAELTEIPPALVTVQTLSGPHATVAQVAYGSAVASGDAKRNNGERTQKNVGIDLAVGRALIELGNQLIDRAYDALPGGAE